jgi:hypothetical protein
MRLCREVPALDALLDAHAVALGADYTAYRNHTYRVANLCAGLVPDGTAHLEKIAIAAATHDLGIWTAGTFDYLPPSIALATAHLAAAGRSEWTAEVTAMIREHHKISAYRGDCGALVEPFRRADWIDVTRGLRSFGLPRGFLRAIFSEWPDAGFRWRLVQLSLQRARTHPFSPLPMLKL